MIVLFNCYGDEIKEKKTDLVHNVHGEVGNTCKILVGKLNAKRPVEGLGIEG